MRKILFLLCFGFLTIAAASYAGASDFIPGFEDLPLMPGLYLENERAVIFDTPAGRIVEAYVMGDIAPEKILSFYEKTLEQLGWEMTAHRVFEREKELLEISMTIDGETTHIIFSLTPL